MANSVKQLEDLLKAQNEVAERNQAENRELFEAVIANLKDLRERVGAYEKAAGSGATKRATRATARKAPAADDAAAPAKGAKGGAAAAAAAGAVKFATSTPNWFKNEFGTNPEFRAQYLSEADFEKMLLSDAEGGVAEVRTKKAKTEAATRLAQYRAAAHTLWKSYDKAAKEALTVLFKAAQKAHTESLRGPVLELDVGDAAAAE